MDPIDILRKAVSGVALNDLRTDTIQLALANLDLMRQRMAEIEAENQRLRAEVDRLTRTQQPPATVPMEPCPYCGQRTFRVIEIRPHPVLGSVGVNERLLRCDACQKEERRTDRRR